MYGPLDPEIKTYTSILEDWGYNVGHSDKGWGPGQIPGREYNPAGQKFENFSTFLGQKATDQPFCYWFGSYNPHRGYKKGSGEEAGLDLTTIDVPGCMPDVPAVVGDIADYYKEVVDFERIQGPRIIMGTRMSFS